MEEVGWEVGVSSFLHVKHHVEIPFDWMTCFAAVASLETWLPSAFIFFLFSYSTCFSLLCTVCVGIKGGDEREYAGEIVTW